MNTESTPVAQTELPTIFEVLESQRAVRQLRSDPIPKEIISSLIHFATLAPSAANRQPWEFIVITDPDVRACIGETYLKASGRLFNYLVENATDESTRKIYSDALHLSSQMGEAAVLVLVCTHVTEERPMADQLPSIYPAVQNLMLAARAYGLGSTLTTAHKRRESEIKEILAIPDDVETVCLIPVGYPALPEVAFKKTTNRRPLDEVLHWNTF